MAMQAWQVTSPTLQVRLNWPRGDSTQAAWRSGRPSSRQPRPLAGRGRHRLLAASWRLKRVMRNPRSAGVAAAALPSGASPRAAPSARAQKAPTHLTAWGRATRSARADAVVCSFTTSPPVAPVAKVPMARILGTAWRKRTSCSVVARPPEAEAQEMFRTMPPWIRATQERGVPKGAAVHVSSTSAPAARAARVHMDPTRAIVRARLRLPWPLAATEAKVGQTKGRGFCRSFSSARTAVMRPATCIVDVALCCPVWAAGGNTCMSG